METISIIIPLAIVSLIVLWEVYWSPMARSTNELARLNRIWEAVNENRDTKEETIQKLAGVKWKYHKDKVELLKMFLTLKK